MHDASQPKHLFATLFGWTVGGLGFLLSFALSLTVFVGQGNPGFLFIWLVAVLATGACVRAHGRWRQSCERMYSAQAVRAYYPARKSWRQNVEDIAFHDMPDAAVSFGQ